MSVAARQAAGEARGTPGGAGSLLATDLGGASGGLAVAAAVGVAFASGEHPVLLAEIGAERGRGPLDPGGGADLELVGDRPER